MSQPAGLQACGQPQNITSGKHHPSLPIPAGQGTSAQAESLAKNVEVRLNELLATVNQAINRVEKSGIQQPAPTVVGRLEQARRWLEQPGK